MVWINEVKNPSRALIHTFKKSAKGLILITADYDAFLFANTITAKHILEALHYWTKEDEIGYELWIVPDKKAKLGFTIEMGNEAIIFHQNNLWTTDESLLLDENPFIEATIKSKNKVTPNPFTREATRKTAKRNKAALDKRIAEGGLEEPPTAL